MSSEEMTIEQARAKLGDRVLAAMNGESTVITRYGRPAAMLVPYVEEPSVTTYIAAIGIIPSVVEGDFCDVTVAESDITTYRLDENDNEIPVYEMSNRIALGPIETTVRTDDVDPWSRLEFEVVEILADKGWAVVSDWEQGDTAAYATVERSDD